MIVSVEDMLMLLKAFSQWKSVKTVLKNQWNWDPTPPQIGPKKDDRDRIRANG